MSILMKTFDDPRGGDLVGPFVRCDHCGQMIDKMQEGHLLHNETVSEALYFVHKKCSYLFEDVHGRHMWCPIDVFLLQLERRLGGYDREETANSLFFT